MEKKFKYQKLVLYLLISLVPCSNSFAQQGWYKVNAQVGYYGIYFKDLNNGMVSRYKTSNGGLTWDTMSAGGYNSFPDLNTGYAVGGSLIFKTTNFGINWIIQLTPSGYSLNSISFINVNTGYACGDAAYLVRTTNGGNNWINVNIPISIEYFLYNVSFIDSLTCYLIGTRYNYSDSASVFLKTTNAGINWTPQYYPQGWGGNFTSMFFININTGYIGTSAHYICKTTNAGTNWNPITIPTMNRIYSLFFINAFTGYGSCYGGQILKTTNGGNNWFLQTTPTGSALYSVFFINNLTGYASGEDYTLLKTTDGGGPPIGIKQISNNIPNKFELNQNYPNPFNPVTKIKFNLPAVVNGRERSLQLKVYDILGREITTLVNEQLKPGIYEIDFNGTNYPSGTYFYTLTAAEYRMTKAMILIK
jgi:photosystem II stability/assembly factor-like uncharacterized protein